jgi:hypothetical protein
MYDSEVCAAAMATKKAPLFNNRFDKTYMITLLCQHMQVKLS